MIDQAQRLAALFAKIEAHPDTYAAHDYDEANIQACENELKIVFPPEFRAFLLRFGSGTYEFGNVSEPDGWDHLIEVQSEWVSEVADGTVLPFAEHEAGECYCFDYRVDTEPRPIVVIDGAELTTWEKVASNFYQLLESGYTD